MNTPSIARRTAVAIAFGLTAAVALPAAAQDQIRIRLAHSLSTSEPAHQAAEFFAKNVAARTNNRDCGGLEPRLPLNTEERQLAIKAGCVHRYHSISSR